MERRDNEYLTLDEAAQLLPGEPTTTSLRRWIRHGVRGGALQAVYQGRWWTTAHWVRQFLDARAVGRIGRQHRQAIDDHAGDALDDLRNEWGLEL